MKTLAHDDLTHVSGGATSSKANDAITQQITALSTSIKDIANNNNKGGDQTMLFLAIAMMNRPSPTVVAAGPAAGPVASGPVVNISTRVRRW